MSLARILALSTLLATSAAGLVGLVASSSTQAAAIDPPAASNKAQSSSAGLPLEGTRWRLIDYVRRGDMRTSGPEVAAWMSLTAGQLTGSSGCRRLDGTYATVGERIAVKPKLRGQRACAEQTMSVEQGLRDGLRRATSFRIMAADDVSSSTLLVSDIDGSELLRFGLDDASALVETEWRLSAYGSPGDMVPADGQQPAVLRFEQRRQDTLARSSQGDVVGSSGCNGLVGRFFRTASVLSFGRLEVTDAPCAAAALAQQAAMLAVLDSASLRLELPPDRLVLTSLDDGSRLEFTSSAALEGSTWLLTNPSGKGSGADGVTFRLSGGRLEGQGPCGAYGGAYEVDEILVTFSQLVGSSDQDCPDARAERRLLEALRRAVIIDRSSARLRLLDAFGTTVVRLERPGGP